MESLVTIGLQNPVFLGGIVQSGRNDKFVIFSCVKQRVFTVVNDFS